jgi:DNA primase
MIDLSKVDVLDLLDRQLEMANVRLTSGGREASFSCPKPGHAHGDERPSAYMNMETTLWWCFGCHAKGTAVSFVAEVKEISIPDAQRWLRDKYGIEFMEPEDGSMVGEIERRLRPRLADPVVIRPNASWLSMLVVDWEGLQRDDRGEPFARYMLDRGFSAEVLDDWQIGYDYTCERVTIPVWGVEGDLVGIKGRAWSQERKPKYLVLGDRGESTKFGFHPYESSQVVFGLHRRRNVRRAAVFEGELDAVALDQILLAHDQVELARPCAIGMSYMSDRHAQIIAQEVDEAVLFGDPDAAGDDFVKGHVSSSGVRQPGAAEMLERYMPVRVVGGHDRDAARYMQDGEGSIVIELIQSARSSLALPVLSG